MAEKVLKGYKIKGNKILADISRLTEEELKAVKNYRALGYELEEIKIKKGITKDEMRAEMAGFPDYVKDFDCAYRIKAKEIDKHADKIKELADKYGIRTKTKEGKPVVGYHLACQIYTKWKKENK